MRCHLVDEIDLAQTPTLVVGQADAAYFRLTSNQARSVSNAGTNVRCSGSADLGRPPIKQMFEPIGCSLLNRATPSRR